MNERYYDFCHGTKVQGQETHLAAVQITPGQKMQSQPGSMVYMSEGIQYNSKYGSILRLANGDRSLWAGKPRHDF